MKKSIFVATFVLCSTIAMAEKVYKVESEGLADIKVYIANNRSDADLCVCFVKSAGEANKDGLWFPVKYGSLADKKVFYVNYASQADLKIYVVEYSSQAGWLNKQKMHILKH
jgi:hypothetical protein